MFVRKYAYNLTVFWIILTSSKIAIYEFIPARNIRHKTCIISDHLLRIYDASFSSCVDECQFRPACVSLNYKRRFRICEINDASISQEAEEKLGCTYVQRTDIVTETEHCLTPCTGRSRCDPATNSCRITECSSPPPVRDAIIHGNQRTVGSKLKYTCSPTGESTIVVCQENGTWSETPVCFVKTLGTTCNVSSDCLEPNSLCIGGKCFCNYTAKYNAQTGICDMVCDKYSSGFNRYERKAISGYNHYKDSSATLQQCKDRCVSVIGATCASFDFSRSGNSCYYGLINHQQVQDVNPSIMRHDDGYDVYT